MSYILLLWLVTDLDQSQELKSFNYLIITMEERENLTIFDQRPSIYTV